MESKLKDTKKIEVNVSGEFKRASEVDMESPMTFGDVPNQNKQIQSDNIKQNNRRSNLFDEAKIRNSGVIRNTIQT